MNLEAKVLMGGLEDFDESKRVEEELVPLIETLTKKAEELNVPLNVTVISKMSVENDDVKTKVWLTSLGRKNENGMMFAPAIIRILAGIVQDSTLLQLLIQNRLKPEASFLNLIASIFNKDDTGAEERGCEPLDCENCLKKDECPIRSSAERAKNLVKNAEETLTTSTERVKVVVQPGLTST